MNALTSPIPSHATPPLSRLLELSSDAVQAVRAGRSLTDVLAKVPPAARAGTQALSFAVLRRMGSAQAVRAGLAPRQPPPNVEALLITALALLWPDEHPPYPDHTLVDQAVTAARKRMPAAASFVNAVLRRFLRERETWVQKVQQDPVAAWNHPLWWIERVRRDWPEHWQVLLQQAHMHPPMALRVHRGRGTPEAYLARLTDAGIPAHLAPGFEDAVVLERGSAVERLPGFAQGDASVQDLSAQRAAGLMLGAGLPPGARVLDACAAPGGKTAHLLERAADLNLLALDADAGRLTRVKQTLDRVGATAELKAADARQVATWWDGQPFDAILLDAPCTASGIVRRHPDIAWLRRPEDVTALAHTQAELLDALWPLLKPGGRLVYATCSIFKAEGQHQIDAFLQRIPKDQARLDADSPGHCLPLPDNGAAASTVAAADGFFYALLHKLKP